MFAANFGHIDIVKILIKSGAEVNLVNEWGTTALSFATIEDHKDIIKILEKII